MWQYIHDLVLKPMSSQPDDFKEGYMAGLLIALFIIVLLLILRIIISWLFREKRCKGIVIKKNGGELFISADAVSEVIRSLQKEFDYIHIDKLYLYVKGAKHKIALHVLFNTEGGGMPAQFDRLNERIKAALNEVFGINSIAKVSVICRKVTISRAIPGKEEKNLSDNRNVIEAEPLSPLKIKFPKPGEKPAEMQEKTEEVKVGSPDKQL